MGQSEKIRCIAVDMGASNIRIMLGEAGRSTLQCREICRFRNETIERDGHERWDIEHILREILGGIAKTVSTHGRDIDSIGVDAWGVDFAMTDEHGALLQLPVAYRDKRTEGMEEKWLESMSREETFQRTGINFYAFNSLFQLLSMKGSRDLGSVSRILFLPSYILSKLCGIGMNELTMASTSQLLSASSGTWDPVILQNLGIPSGVLGEVCSPGTILGRVDHPDLDLRGTDVVAVCSHDTASAVVSVPFEDDRSVFISTGTWCIVGTESERPVLTPEALRMGFTNERGYGGSFRILKNIVGLWLVQGLVKSLPVREDYDEIESLAFHYNGDTHIIHPGDPVFYNPSNMREAFDAYFKKTGQDLPHGPGGYFRAAYDSLIFSFRYHIEQIEEMTVSKVETVHLIGGGCQSGYLTRQTAAICRRRVVSGPVEAAAIGNVLVQAISKGVLPDLAEARKLVRTFLSVRVFNPGNPEASHELSYRKFLRLLPA